MEQGHFLLPAALSPLGKALERLTSLQASFNHLTQEDGCQGMVWPIPFINGMHHHRQRVIARSRSLKQQGL